METAIPDSRVLDTQEDFENLSQVNAAETTEAQGMRNLNRKRTYDVYQDFDVQAVRAAQRAAERNEVIATQALQNAVETANMVAKQAIKHADVAADALWTDELNPVTRGAGNDLTGQSGVNSELASTASLNVAFSSIFGQMGEMVSAIVGLANSQATQNLALAQLIQNGKQPAPAAPSA